MENYKSLNYSNISAGFYDSKFQYSGVTYTPLRTLVFYEIEYFLSDDGICYLNDIPYPIKKGSVMYGPKGTKRYSKLPIQTYFIRFIIENESLKNIFNKPFLIYPSTEKSAEIGKMFRSLIEHLRFGNQQEFFSELKISEILYSAYQCNNPEDKSQDGNLSPTIVRAINYIDAHFSNNISLEDIAREVFLSPVYFHNLFLKETGKTPHNYLISRRLNEAKMLLSCTNENATTIAQNCGFSSQSHFNQVFKRNLMITPMEYRKKNFKKYEL